MTGPLVVRLVRLANPAFGPSSLDGLWLVEYDPRRPGTAPDGRPLVSHLIASARLPEARRFDDIAEVHRYVYAESGLPAPRDRPLSAYTLEVLSEQRAAADEADR